VPSLNKSSITVAANLTSAYMGWAPHTLPAITGSDHHVTCCCAPHDSTCPLTAARLTVQGTQCVCGRHTSSRVPHQTPIIPFSKSQHATYTVLALAGAYQTFYSTCHRLRGIDTASFNAVAPVCRNPATPQRTDVSHAHSSSLTTPAPRTVAVRQKWRLAGCSCHGRLYHKVNCVPTP
jgi:hypothetical protein